MSNSPARAWIEMARPLNILLGGVTCLLGGYMTGVDSTTFTGLVLSAASVMSFMAAGNMINDIMDHALDEEAHPYRPIPSGRVDRNVAKGVVWGLGLISAILMALSIRYTWEFASWQATLGIWMLAAILMLSYDLGPRTKTMGLPGNIVISLMVGSVILFGAASVGSLHSGLIWLVAATAFWTNLAREMVKDCEDMDSDVGRHTLPMRIGREKTRMAAYAVSMGGVICGALPFYLDLFPMRYILLQLPAILLILTCNRLLSTGDDAGAQRRLRLSLVMGLMGFSVATYLS